MSDRRRRLVAAVVAAAMIGGRRSAVGCSRWLVGEVGGSRGSSGDIAVVVVVAVKSTQVSSWIRRHGMNGPRRT